ncbi:hypothetical protein [Bartonella rattimassiliensis]|uniref:Plasmid replication protein RepL domain-containing protein n=1 Tax=Bartonella rattimassiliensis 15908 TaxID=1094556 RepID=J1JDV2_9HYPH|nr:hypothetical protein [Bartonella rattimassiliensis]EJF82652.1 hypothetical protein MCY_01709 [Bartonella rattimassiliensis 15908]
MDKINLRKQKFSPRENPFLKKSEIFADNKIVKTSITQQKFINSETNRTEVIPTIHVTGKTNEENFIEIFADGIQTVFNLSRTGHRALVIVLEERQSNKLENKNNNSITLIWFDGGVNGKKRDMVDRTFHNGLRELIQKGILKPKLPNQYWVNPILLFKGDKIIFMKEYKIELSSTKSDISSVEYQTDLEDFTKI